MPGINLRTRATTAMIFLLAAGSTPPQMTTVDDGSSADFNCMQAPLNVVLTGDTVMVSPRIFTGTIITCNATNLYVPGAYVSKYC